MKERRGRWWKEWKNRKKEEKKEEKEGGKTRREGRRKDKDCCDFLLLNRFTFYFLVRSLQTHPLSNHS